LYLRAETARSANRADKMKAPLGLIAGLGELPVAIAENAVATGQGVYVLRLRGFEEPALEKYDGSIVGLGEIGAVMDCGLQRSGLRRQCQPARFQESQARL
jgi:DUF1009 family protein